MKKLLLSILGPIVAVSAIVVGIIWWDRGAPPGFRPPTVDVALSDLSFDHRGVRVEGTAHYNIRLTQGDYLIYPLMARGDTTGKNILAMVRTRRMPDRLIGLEDVTVEGFARPPGQIINRSVTEPLLARGYSFDEDFVLILEYDD